MARTAIQDTELGERTIRKGAHFCLGKSLAVLEIDLIFNALSTPCHRCGSARTRGPLRSAWINGVKELRASAGE